MIEKKTIPTISAEAEILYGRIRQLGPGETVTYAELGASIRSDVQGEARGILTTARRKAERDDEIVTECVRGVGIQRISGESFVDMTRAGVKKVRRATKRALQRSLRMPQAEYDALPNQSKVEINTERTILGTMHHFTKPKSRDEISKRIEVSNNRLTVGEVLEINKS